MQLCKTLPTPEKVAREIDVARRERVLLRRLYRLAIEARDLNRVRAGHADAPDQFGEASND